MLSQLKRIKRLSAEKWFQHGSILCQLAIFGYVADSAYSQHIQKVNSVSRNYSKFHFEVCFHLMMQTALF